MNFIIVILSVIIIVILFYIGFKSYFSKKSTLTSQTSLADGSKPVPDIISSNIQKPDSTRYAYGLWIYVNTLNAPTAKSIIFSRNNDLILYLDQNNTTLTAVVNPQIDSTNTSSTSPIVVSNESNLNKPRVPPSTGVSPSTKINITNNFPLQKWVYIVISIDNTVADCYLDGKLIKSVKITQVAPDKTAPVKFGLGVDAYIAQFQRWTNPLDPQSVWKAYAAGSGSSLAGTDSNYNVALSVLKDNVITSKLTLY
jgi:hypothetical protein